MRRSLLTVGAVAIALSLGISDARAQNTTIVQLNANYTPIGQLPDGKYMKSPNAIPGTMVISLQARDPGGFILLNRNGTEDRYEFEFYNPEGYKGGSSYDLISIYYRGDNDSYVSCTLSRREANRFSGVCWNEFQQKGWMEVMGPGGRPITPGEWPGATS